MERSISFFSIPILATFLAIVSFSCNEDEKLVPAPVITGFYPNSGIVGSSVVIYGNNFVIPADTVGARLNNTSIVKFNGILAEAIYGRQDSVNVQSISTSVPVGATSGKITVTANGITSASPDEFKVTFPVYLPNVTVSTVSNYNSYDIDIDAEGNLYVVQSEYSTIVKIANDGTIDTLFFSLDFADRPILGIAVDDDRNVYATVGHSIRKITPDGTVLTLAGGPVYGFADGQGGEAKFFIPWGIDVDHNGNIYVADLLNYKIRKISPEGMVTTLAGSTEGYMDGAGSSARFSSPKGVKVDTQGNVYVAESYNIRKITPDGFVSTIAGNNPAGYYDAPVAQAQFNFPFGIEVDALENLYITDELNFVVRRIGTDGEVVTVAGVGIPGHMDGAGSSARFCQTKGITMDAAGALYVCDACGGIRKIVIN